MHLHMIAPLAHPPPVNISFCCRMSRNLDVIFLRTSPIMLAFENYAILMLAKGES
jgi:hypothetical protein